MNFPSRNKPAAIWINPIRTTVAKRYWTPCSATRETITTANAPVAPEIMPGRPPINAVIRPTMKAAYRPTSGWTPATKANATASGTRAKATVSPAKISVFKRLGDTRPIPSSELGVAAANDCLSKAIPNIYVRERWRRDYMHSLLRCNIVDSNFSLTH